MVSILTNVSGSFGLNYCHSYHVKLVLNMIVYQMHKKRRLLDMSAYPAKRSLEYPHHVYKV